jgi:hypothetical protein
MVRKKIIIGGIMVSNLQATLPGSYHIEAPLLGVSPAVLLCMLPVTIKNQCLSLIPSFTLILSGLILIW